MDPVPRHSCVGQRGSTPLGFVSSTFSPFSQSMRGRVMSQSPAWVWSQRMAPRAGKGLCPAPGPPEVLVCGGIEFSSTQILIFP